MGRMKEKWMDTLERRRSALLAKVLGITLDELDQTNWELEEITNNEEMVIEVLVKFTDSPEDILSKIGLNKGETEYSIDANALSNAEHLYNHYAKILGIPYPELLYSDTEESDVIEKDGQTGIYLKFSPDTPYERLGRIKHNGLTEDYQTWLPYP